MLADGERAAEGCVADGGALRSSGNPLPQARAVGVEDS